jgi:hypothetical protein
MGKCEDYPVGARFDQNLLFGLNQQGAINRRGGLSFTDRGHFRNLGRIQKAKATPTQSREEQQQNKTDNNIPGNASNLPERA